MPGTRTKEAYNRILRKLTNGEFQAGDRLVNRLLAKELGISAIPVREALQRLASEGLVDHVPGGGMYARQLSSREVVQLYAFREQLECFAAGEVAIHGSDHQIAELRSILDRARALVDRIESCPADQPDPQLAADWLNLDATFHEILIEAADNVWLSRAASQIHLIHYVLRSKSTDQALLDVRQTLAEHEAILGAIRSGDGDGAMKRMREHIHHAREYSLHSRANRR